MGQMSSLFLAITLLFSILITGYVNSSEKSFEATLKPKLVIRDVVWDTTSLSNSTICYIGVIRGLVKNENDIEAKNYSVSCNIYYKGKLLSTIKSDSPSSQNNLNPDDEEMFQVYNLTDPGWWISYPSDECKAAGAKDCISLCSGLNIECQAYCENC